MKLKKPRKPYQKETTERIEYKNVSYRLPVKTLNKLDELVDENTSACKIVAQILAWGLGLEK